MAISVWDKPTPYSFTPLPYNLMMRAGMAKEKEIEKSLDDVSLLEELKSKVPYAKTIYGYDEDKNSPTFGQATYIKNTRDEKSVNDFIGNLDSGIKEALSKGDPSSKEFKDIIRRVKNYATTEMSPTGSIGTAKMVADVEKQRYEDRVKSKDDLGVKYTGHVHAKQGSDYVYGRNDVIGSSPIDKYFDRSGFISSLASKLKADNVDGQTFSAYTKDRDILTRATKGVSSGRIDGLVQNVFKENPQLNNSIDSQVEYEAYQNSLRGLPSDNSWKENRKKEVFGNLLEEARSQAYETKTEKLTAGALSNERDKATGKEQALVYLKPVEDFVTTRNGVKVKAESISLQNRPFQTVSSEPNFDDILIDKVSAIKVGGNEVLYYTGRRIVYKKDEVTGAVIKDEVTGEKQIDVTKSEYLYEPLTKTLLMAIENHVNEDGLKLPKSWHSDAQHVVVEYNKKGVPIRTKKIGEFNKL